LFPTCKREVIGNFVPVGSCCSQAARALYPFQNFLWGMWLNRKFSSKYQDNQ
jgi:hypothetical protein